MPANTLYYGDNIDVLREYLKDETVDLVYLDPPFNSKRDYNLLFKTPAGHESESQVTAFVDSWHWGEQAEAEYSQILHQRNTQLAEMMRGFRSFLGENDVMAYLTMMANRLLELHRVMKPTASIYLHCDPTASHYLKLLMDAVFGAANFRNEIVWCYKSRPQSKRYFGRKHDTILFYTKSDAYYFDWESVVRPLSESTVNKYRLIDENGRKYRLEGRGITGSPIRSAKDVEQKWEISHPELVVRDYLDEKIGVCQEDWWTDINIINQSATERLGYPTQKPESLLERIINASSSPGDLVLDPFCGCGTAVVAAEKLERKWIGIDITHLAVALIEKRMQDTFPDITFDVVGTPKDLEAARDLAQRNKYQFQWWACSLVKAQPYDGKKKGADGGVDGLIFFQDDAHGSKKIVVSVKGGDKVSVAMVRDLRAVVEREHAAIGLFVTLSAPTAPMLVEATSAGWYVSPTIDANFPRIQLLTIEGLLNGTEAPRYPDLTRGGLTFKRAQQKSVKESTGRLIGE